MNSTLPGEQAEANIPTQERPLYLLGFFTAQQPTWTLSKLARASGLPTASCLRALRVLEKYRFLRREHTHYMLGPQLVYLSTQAQRTSPARRLALPALEHLHQTAARTVFWAVLEGQEAHLMDVFPAALETGTLRPGDRLDLTRGAAARVLLAFAPQDVRRAVLAASWDALPHRRSHLEVLDTLTRKAWLALETTPDPDARLELAAPVFQSNGGLVAAIGLMVREATSVPRARLEHELNLLNQAASRISRELGYDREWHGDPAFFLQMTETLKLLDAPEDAGVGSDLINYPL